jgi:hypothetical protein
VPGNVATIKNNGASGIGWSLTAVTGCLVTLHMFARYNTTGGGQGANGAIGYWPAAPAAAMPAAGTNRPAFSETDQTFGAESKGVNSDASIVLEPGDSITVYQFIFGAPTPAVLTLSGAVIQL